MTKKLDNWKPDINDDIDISLDGAPRKIKVMGNNIYKVNASKEQKPMVLSSSASRGSQLGTGPIKAGKLTIKKSDVKLKE